MKRKLTATLAALTIGVLGATASAQPYPNTSNRDNVVDKRHIVVRAPVIKSMPASVTLGKTMSIKGRFLPTRAVLQLGGTRIRPLLAQPNHLKFAIPDDMKPGSYRARLVWKRGDQYIGRLAVEAPYYAPIVNPIPSAAILGKSLTITGEYLPAGAVLKLGRHTLRARYASSTKITFVIPAGLVAKGYRAKLVARGFTENLGWLKLEKPYYAPVITNVPGTAVLGKRLVITGRYLPADAILKIGSKLIKPVYASANRLAFTVPASLNAWTYSMKLLMPRGNKHLGRIKLQRPYYRPQVTWSPKSVTKGHTLTITGRHLPANAVLKIGRYSFRASYASATRLEFKVPRYLRTGNYAMKLVTPRHTQSLGVVRVRAPHRHYWSWNLSAFFNFGLGS